MDSKDTPREVGLSEGLATGGAEARDPHRGGSSYEASMLRNLLARIHRDGGHYVEEHGLDKALEDAEAKIVEWLALQDKVGMAYGYLWCVNNEPGKPHHMPPERMAYEARKLLRDTMTHDERGQYINAVLPLVRGPGG